MWKSKIVRQTIVCLVAAAVFFTASHTDIALLQKGSQTAVAYLSQNYTVGDGLAAAKTGVQTIAGAPAAMTGAILTAKEKMKFGKPIDDVKDGETVSVYAVGAGTVTSVGENDKIGKFIKITHGDEAVSIYGNCETIQVKELDRVKKGQAIATFKKEEGHDFYYSLNEK
ncbi:M23 family metallopeptidase [bacterium 210820-DFI.6.37]|nr:M23 family metallopeptidase [bacterium 210820-DFI.6.37]